MSKTSVTDNIIEIWKKTGKVSIINSSGRCMIPLFDDGTPLIVKHVQSEDIGIGDIAVFRSSNQTVAHRIIDKIYQGERLYFLEKRDSGFEPGMIPENAIIGKVIGFQKGDRRINLEKGIWKITNKIVGYYWLFFNALYKGVRSFKKRIFKEKRVGLASKVYSIVSSLLIQIAHSFISLIHRLSLPKNKP